MKISLDAGALCVPHDNQFGTYIVTKNIIEALGRYETNNSYTAYTFEKIPVIAPHHPNIIHKILRPPFAWMALRVSFEELLRPKQVYLGLSQAVPWYTKAKVITFLHGFSFFFHKELYPQSYEALKDQVLFAISRSNHVIVSSERVQKELKTEFGYDKSTVIPYGVPFDILESKKGSAPAKKPYFLFVGMNHPIKNIKFLVHAFTIFKEHSSRKDFELLLVGNHKEFENKKLGIYAINPKREDLKALYSHASGYLSSSLYESFNLPVLEALSSGCRVVGKSSAIIPEFRNFVTIADELEEFVNAMSEISQRAPLKGNSKFPKNCDWETFITSLIKLYSV